MSTRRSRASGPAAMIILPSPTPLPSFWPASRRWRGGARPSRRPPSFAPTITSMTSLRAPRNAQGAVKPILLQPRELKLLEYLMRNAGNVVTRTMLLENVWDYHFDPQTNVIDVHVSRLRQKIDRNFDRPLLHTVRGAGYCLRAGD